MGTTTARAISPAKVLAVLMALVVALAFIPSAAYAVSSKTVKKAGFTTTTKVIEKKATKVKKGTTNLTFKKGQGYVKFTATKTKTYRFTFSNVTSGSGSSAFVEVQRPEARSPQYSYMTKVRTKGGKTTTLWLSQNGYKYTSGKLLYRNLPSRTATIKLKKGQKVYFYFYSSTGKTKAKLKIR